MPLTIAPVSRRRFLLQSGAAVCFGWSARPSRAAGPGEGEGEVWALFSDTHINANPDEMSRGVAMAANLEACVSEVLGQARKIAGVIVNGDCAHISGLQADYETLRPLLQPLTEAQIPVHLLMGNHDDRVTFAAAMGRAAATVVESRFVAVQESPLVNWFLLDSLDEVNVTPGRLGEVQLAWLAKELDARTDKPAIVVVHHNIVKEPQITALQDSAALLALVRPRRQVKACFFGHIHHWEQTVDESGLHVVSLPPTSYVFRPESPNGWVRAVPRRDGMDLELRCLNVRHPQHGEVKKLAWRV